MSGTIRVGTPWMRAALADFTANFPDDLTVIENAIPDGHHISLICGGRPRPLGAILVGPSGHVARVEPAYHTVSGACWAVLAAARTVAA